MKARHGFVSNSSSSSFIVEFPKGLEKTVDAVGKYVFGDSYPNGIHAAYSEGITVKQAAEIITADLQRQTPNDIEQIRDNIHEHRSWREWPDLPADRNDAKAMEAYRSAVDRIHMEDDRRKGLTVAAILGEAEANGNEVFVFEYCDNEGTVGSVMEHGNTFRRVKHRAYSNH